MAELKLVGDELLLKLSHSERFEAVHGDLRVPLSGVRPIEVLDDAHEPVDHGLKDGERIPGISEVAAVRTDGKKIFAAVPRDTPRGVRIVLDGASYDEWIVGCADPDAVKSQIEQHQ